MSSTNPVPVPMNWEMIYRLNPAIERAGVSLPTFLHNPMEAIENVLYAGVNTVYMDTRRFLPLLPRQYAVQQTTLFPRQQESMETPYAADWREETINAICSGELNIDASVSIEFEPVKK